MVRVGLVGCGRVAERGYLPALRRTSHLELAAVADAHPGRAAAVAPDVPGYRDAESMLAGERLDLLVVASPSDAHLEGARAAACAGVQALVEKPPARTFADAAVLTELAPMPWIGFSRRFEPRLQALRSLLDQYSEPVSLELSLEVENHVWASHSASDGPLLDLGSHLVDLASWLTRRPVERVRAEQRGRAAHRLDLDLAGARASLTLAHDRRWAERILAHDVHGTVIDRFTAGGFTGRLLARLGVARAATLVDLLTAQLEAAARALREGVRTDVLATAVDGLEVMAVLASAQASLDDGGSWISVVRRGSD